MSEQDEFKTLRAAAARARQSEVLLHLSNAYMELTRANGPAVDPLCDDVWKMIHTVVELPSDSFA